MLVPLARDYGQAVVCAFWLGIFPHESANLVEAIGLPENKNDLRAFAWGHGNVDHQRSAGISQRAKVPCKVGVSQSRRLRYGTVRAQKLGAIASGRAHIPTCRSKCQFAGKVTLPDVPRNDGLRLKIAFTDNLHRGVFTLRPENPFGEVRCRQMARLRCVVAKSKVDDLDRILRRNMHRQFLVQEPAVAFVPAVALPMSNGDNRPVSQWQGGGRPKLSSFLVPQVDDLAGWIRNWIVRPGRQSV